MSSHKNTDRFVRLLQLYALIKTHPHKYRLRDLEHHFAVSKNTLLQDLELLRKVGIDIRGSRRRGEGYHLQSDTLIIPSVFSTKEEVFALIYSLRQLEHASGNPLAKDIRSALSKIIDQLPQHLQDAAQHLNSRLSLQPTEWSIPAHIIETLHTAIAEKRRVQMVYYSKSSDEITQREMSPYVMASKGHSLYVIGYCHRRHKIRTFKIIRIQEIRVLPATWSYKPCTDPEHQKIVDEILGNGHVFTGEKQKAVIRIDKKMAILAKEYPFANTKRTFADQEDGSTLMSIWMSEPLQAAWWALRFGGSAEILEPEHVREWVKNEVKKMQEKYG